MDIMLPLMKKWDMIIAFPPCTHLAVSGARWFKEKQADGRQLAGINLFMLFTGLDCEKVAIENPIGIMSTKYRKPDQIIHPWQFGHGETKATCLWLKGLPKLEPTNIVSGREQRVWKMAPSPERSMLRSKTFPGIAKAMAQQWGNLANENIFKDHKLIYLETEKRTRVFKLDVKMRKNRQYPPNMQFNPQIQLPPIQIPQQFQSNMQDIMKFIQQWVQTNLPGIINASFDSFKKDFPIIGYERQHINKKWLDE